MFGILVSVMKEKLREKAKRRQELTKLVGKGVQKKDVMVVSNLNLPKTKFNR
jgi:hypothetical protein